MVNMAAFGLKKSKTTPKFKEIKRLQGVVHVNADWCKGCKICVAFCPTNALEMGKEFNKKGYHAPFLVRPDDCVDCKYCESICPEFSIFVTHIERK